MCRLHQKENYVIQQFNHLGALKTAVRTEWQAAATVTLISSRVIDISYSVEKHHTRDNAGKPSGALTRTHFQRQIEFVVAWCVRR